MKYNLDELGSLNFEHLVQSLTKKILGNGAITFGSGADGGREASYEGRAPFPSISEQWDGYWVIQAKFKENISNNNSDFSWVKKELTEELDKYSTRVTRVKFPDNYLLFTNVILTAKAQTGGQDKITECK